jgi:hypothetical protein
MTTESKKSGNAAKLEQLHGGRAGRNKVDRKDRSAATYLLFASCAAVARWGLSSGVLFMLN